MTPVVRPVTRAKAEEVLAAVRRKFAGYISDGNEPELIEDYQDRGHWAIAWEGGPFQWTYNPLDSGDVDEEMSALAGRPVKFPAVPVPAGVFTEAHSHYALMIYPG